MLGEFLEFTADNFYYAHRGRGGEWLRAGVDVLSGCFEGRARFATSPGAHTGYVHREGIIPFTASIGCTPTLQSGHCAEGASPTKPVPLGPDRGALTSSQILPESVVVSCMEHSSVREVVMTFWMLLLVIAGPSLIGLGIQAWLER